MSNFSQFFLNTSSSVVQLELLEISHPVFSKVYRIVRNAINGVTVTLEDSSVATFDYYPVKITPTGNANDLDQTLQLQFGDLGDILPQELDRVLINHIQHVLLLGSLIGTFTDTAGNIINRPFYIGSGISVYVPAGATKLSLGINDNGYGDNWGSFDVVINGAAPVTVIGNAQPWQYVPGGINDAFPFNTWFQPPVLVSGLSGLLKIEVTGLVALQGLLPPPSSTFFGPDGNPGFPAAPGDGSAGNNILTDPPPGTYVKPLVIYRTYRSDDLTAPLNGPIRFEITNIGFKRDGSTIQCNAPRLNQSATGEIYTMDRFPMLRGFL